MKDDLASFIQSIRSNSNLLSLGELALKSGIIEPVLRLLGWDTSIVGSEVTLEYSVEGGRVDYCLHSRNTRLVFLEAKKPSESLDRHSEQLLGYSFRQGIKLAILSNGITWSFYLPLTEAKWDRRCFYTVDFIEQDPSEAAAHLVEFLSKDSVISGNAVANAERLLAGRRRQEIIGDSLPDAWNRIVSEPDSLLGEILAERTNRICGFEPTPEDIADFFQRNASNLLLTPEEDSVDYPITSPRASASQAPGFTHVKEGSAHS